MSHKVRHLTVQIPLRTSQLQHTPRSIAENLRSRHTTSSPPPHSILPTTVPNKFVLLSSYLSRFIQILPPTNFIPSLLRHTNQVHTAQSFSRHPRPFSWPPPLCKTESPLRDPILNSGHSTRNIQGQIQVPATQALVWGDTAAIFFFS